jgi:hypothetical protein
MTLKFNHLNIVLFCLGLFMHSSANAQTKLSDEQTKATFELFWASGSDLSITDEDKEKAAYFLNELIEGTCDMSIVQGMSNFNGTLLSACNSIYTGYNGCTDAGRKGRYSETIRKEIARKQKSMFEIRKQTGEW